MRVFHLWTIMHKNQPHVTYKNLKKISEYYARTNNLFMLAHAYIDMGNILSRLKDYPKALEYLQKADSYYKKFAAMETALAKLQQSTSSLSGLLGS